MRKCYDKFLTQHGKTGYVVGENKEYYSRIEIPETELTKTQADEVLWMVIDKFCNKMNIESNNKNTILGQRVIGMSHGTWSGF